MTGDALRLLYWRVPAARTRVAARTRAARVLPAGALLLALAGCSSGSPAAPARATTAVPSPTSSTAAVAAPAGPTPAPVDEGADLVLQGDGLSLLQADTPQPLPFGTATGAGVRSALSAALGDVTQTDAVPCPQGPRTELAVDGFSVLLDADRLVGWTDDGAPDRSLTTPDGVGTGTHLADLRSALPDLQLAPSGTAWSSAGGLSGALSGPDPAATVTVISAGQTCPH